MKNMLFALQSGFEPMVVRMINLPTKLVYVVRECVAEHFPFFITQRERHRALSSIAMSVGIWAARYSRSAAPTVCPPRSMTARRVRKKAERLSASASDA